jgi:hypothetical protein
MGSLRALLATTLLAVLDGSAASPEEYDIYSGVLAHPTFSHPGENRIYLIADTTGLTYSVQDPRTCIQVPAAYQRQFQEVLADYDRRKNERNRLTRAFHLEKPYELLSEEDAREFVRERFYGNRSGETGRARFAQAIDLVRLSNVYFSRDRTLALTAMSSYCGGLCGLQAWRIFEKTGQGKWIERKWTTCLTISLRRPSSFHAACAG